MTSDNRLHPASFLFTIGGRGNGPGQFTMPSGLFLDPANRLYVCDAYNQRVQIFQLSGGGAHE